MSSWSPKSEHRLWLIISLSFLFHLSAANGVTRREYLTVKFPQGPLPDTQVEVRRSQALNFVDLGDLVAALNLRTWINRERCKIQFGGAMSVKWTGDNAFVIVGQEVLQLRSEVLFLENKFWAPLEECLEILRRIYPAKIAYLPALRSITVIPSEFDVYAIQYESKGNGTLIRISCTKAVEIAQRLLSDQYLSLTLLNAKVDQSALELATPAGVVEELRIEEQPLQTRLLFRITAPALEYSVTFEEESQQLLISLVTKILNLSSDSLLASSKLEGIAAHLEKEQQKWQLDCVVIDPGHGGKDPGAIGVTGLREKEVVLDIALRLKALLEEKTDLRVVLTRSDDRFIPLSERTKIANRQEGKIFISIHCNSTKRGTNAAGFETYFLKPARTQRAMEVALLENSVIDFEESKSQYQDLTSENYILLAMAQSEFLRESERLADLVQSKMRLNTGLKDRGVDQAGFFVLVGASMPAILFETAFLSNKNEEKLLRTKKFRQRVAQALFEGISVFIQQEVTLERSNSTTR